MTTAVLTISSSSLADPSSTGSAVAGIAEAADRVVSIIRRYATNAVALAGDGTIRVDLDRINWVCEPTERARRIAGLASSWTGHRVDVQITRPRDAAGAGGPFSVNLARRASEVPAAFRDRLAEAATRLSALAEGFALQPNHWMLILQSDSSSVSMPLPGTTFDDGAFSIAHRLPDRAFEGVSSLRLEARVCRRVAAPREESHVPVQLHGRSQPLPLVS
jgi:hypothetical protein